MVTKGSLLETIWPGVHVTEAILSVYVAEIRKALGEDPKKPVFIETLHRRGYRFIAPVTIDRTTEISESTAGSEELIRPIVREAATAIGAEPMIGREKELSFLLEKLDSGAARDGERCVYHRSSRDRKDPAGTRAPRSRRARWLSMVHRQIRKIWKPSLCGLGRHAEGISPAQGTLPHCASLSAHTQQQLASIMPWSDAAGK